MFMNIYMLVSMRFLSIHMYSNVPEMAELICVGVL